MLRALVERRIGRRDQANAWIWRLAEYTRDVHEEYAVQRWPETKRLLGLLVNSAGGAHARNARRLIHAARKQDRRLAAALLAAALAHTPEAEEALRGARTRMARKPPALARELLRNFPKRRARNSRRRRKGGCRTGAGAEGASGCLRASAAGRRAVAGRSTLGRAPAGERRLERGEVRPRGSAGHGAPGAPRRPRASSGRPPPAPPPDARRRRSPARRPPARPRARVPAPAQPIVRPRSASRARQALSISPVG